MHISAVKLVRQGRDAVVEIEFAPGYWVEVIREPYDACFSHIVEESGMRKARSDAIQEQSYRDLAASGGIVDAP